MNTKKYKKDSPFTSIGIHLELCDFLKRNVLFEKFSFDKTKQIEMTNFIISKIDGCKLIVHKDYKESIFFEKNGEILFEKHIGNKYFYIKYTGFWQTLETKYGLNHTENQSFTEIVLEDLLKSQVYKTNWWNFRCWLKLEGLLKSQKYAT